MFQLIAFYPSLAYNLVRNYLQPKKWSWYNRIDDVVILGGLPFQSTAKQLLKENVGGVVCCTEDYELRAAFNAMKPADWLNLSVAVHQVPMKDFTGAAPINDINMAVAFIKGIGKSGKSVYVHCKAGRTRSALIVMCYLMQKNNWMANVAFDYVKMHRPQAIMRTNQWRTVNEYRLFLDGTSNSFLSK
uniref:Phosphatidylglycerophosphatase and protein-tyrosine phosphatase 1 n=1 Tax=Syphacia muris TaxID=451379 RepID=A0A0N5ALM4_9BILA